MHTVVAETADLGAEDGVGAGDFGGEVDVIVLAGDCVLLDAHLRDGKAVNNVLGTEGKVDFVAGGKDEFAADEVVAAISIAWVEAEGIACTWIGESK